MFNLHHFHDLIQFKLCINVYIYKKLYINVIHSIFVNWNLIKQKHTVGPFSNICLGQCGITEPMNQCCDCKGHDLHSHVPPPPMCASGNRRGVKMKLYQGWDQLPLSSCFSLQSTVWWRDCSPAKDLGNWEFRPVKAALMLSSTCHPFLEECSREVALQVLPLWPCCDAEPWGNGDKRMPRYSSDGH